MDLDFTKKVVEKIWYSSWKEIVEKLSDPVYGKDKNLAFRGQSNFDKNKFPTSESSIWQINSSFNRFYDEYPFSSRLGFPSNSTIFKKMISQYTHIPDIDSLAKLSYIETLNYFQHYGIPTPFIDLSLDFNIALYFSACDIMYKKSLSPDDFPGCYCSLMEIDLGILKDEFNITSYQVDPKEDFSLEKVKFKFSPVQPEIDLFIYQPDLSLTSINRNIILQKGCFIYLDFIESLDQILDECFKVLKNKPIKYHMFPYNTILYNDANDGLWFYLKRKKCIGSNLFSDIRGLKYDLNFMHSGPF